MKNTVVFTGGLGNQLFQFVFMLYLKEITDNEVMYNLSSFLNRNVHSGFQADQVFDFSEFKEDSRDYYTIPCRLAKKFSKKNSLFKKIVPFCSDQDFAEGLRKPVYEGFWQKSIYYEMVKSNICKYTKEISRFCKDTELMQAISTQESVMVHVRRGDYVNNPVYCDLTETKYYENAINIIRANIESPFFYVFSDNVPWCKKYFSDLEDCCFVEYYAQSALGDLVLMSKCKHAIIANSSYSWWGAALGQKGLTIYPSAYYRNQTVSDLYPSGWIKCEV